MVETTGTDETRETTGASRLCVTMQKGGVGKTTTAINLAGALNQRGHNVLFVDADPQGNATEGLGLADAYEPATTTLYDALTDDHTVAPELIRATPEMDVLPSNVEMFNVESELNGAMRARQRLNRALDHIEQEGDYDYIIVDSPPWLGILTDSALVATGNVVLPALAESTSERALEILFEQIATVEDQYDMTINEVALVANRINNDGEATKMLKWFHEHFEPAVPVVEIRKRVAIKRAWSNGISIMAGDEPCDMTERYTELAALVEDRT